ncbi:Hpt domain-containing protein [Devosia sp.]|uniref:Hpt domain-containing protein n=1 Tax=Devosia sp. TaxID=1871048 RepID=UPI003A943A45
MSEHSIRMHEQAMPQRGGPIDMVHLERQSLGDPGLQDEVLRLYSDMSLVYLERIETSTTVPDLLRNLHTLRSAAAGVGAATVRDLVAHAEGALRDGADVNPEWVDEIAEAVTECRDYISRLVAA